MAASVMAMDVSMKAKSESGGWQRGGSVMAAVVKRK